MVESTVLYDIDPDLYSLIANLRIIGNLKEGERINLVATMEKSMFRNFPELRLRIVDIL